MSIEKTVLYADYYAAANCQILLGVYGYMDVLKIIQNWNVSMFNQMYAFVNSLYYYELRNGARKPNFDLALCENELPLAFCHGGLNQYEKKILDYQDKINANLPKPGLGDNLIIPITGTTNVILRNSSIVQTAALSSLYSVVLKNFKLLNKIGAHDLCENAKSSFQDLGDVLYNRGEVFDIGTDFYYFYDRFNFALNNDTIFISLKPDNKIKNDLNHYFDAINQFLIGLNARAKANSLFSFDATPAQVDMLFSAFGVDHIMKKIFLFVHWMKTFVELKTYINTLSMSFPFPYNDDFKSISPISQQYLDAYVEVVNTVPLTSIPAFDSTIYVNNLNCCINDEQKDALLYSKYQYYLRLNRLADPMRDKSSKDMSALSFDHYGYFSSIVKKSGLFNDPRLFSMVADTNTINNGWAFAFLQAIKNNNSKNVVRYHHQHGAKFPVVFAAYPNVEIVRENYNVNYREFDRSDLTFHCYDLVSTFVKDGKNTWFSMCQQDFSYVDFFFDEFFPFLTSMVDYCNLHINDETYKPGRSFLIKLPYVFSRYSRFLSRLNDFTTYSDVIFFPSNTPHEEFFLFVF